MRESPDSSPPSFAPAPSSRGIHGLAELTFVTREGQTRLGTSRTRPPLVVQRALYLDDCLPDLAVVYLGNPTAGVFAGDVVEVSASVESGAKAQIRTPSSTKVHAMPVGEARQVTHLDVHAGGYLEYLPEPVIPQRGARFRQSTTIVVAPGGALVYAEILSGGRLAMGESLVYGEAANQLSVLTPDGRLLYHEAAVIRPAALWPLGVGILGRRGETSLATVLVVAEQTNPGTLAAMVVEGVSGIEGARSGVDVLPGGGGIVLKALSADTSPLRSVVRVVWDIGRRAITGAALTAGRASSHSLG